MKCDRCGDDVNGTTVLKNVKVSGGVVSSLRSRMRVCFDCKREMEASDSYEW